MKLYITRHGTTEWNVIRRLQGSNDSSLTQEGVEIAKKLGMSLKDIQFDIIYSSPQYRALHTAKLIRGNKDTQIKTHEGLKELSFGTWEGMDISQIEKSYPEEFYTYMNNPKDYIPIGGGETFKELFIRVESFLNEIVKLNVENILIVTHGVTIKALLAIIKKLTVTEFAALPVYTGTALNICEVVDGDIKLCVEGDISHIDTEPFEESNM